MKPIRKDKVEDAAPPKSAHRNREWRVNGKRCFPSFHPARNGRIEEPALNSVHRTKDVTSRTWGVLIAQHQRQKLVKDNLTKNGVEHFVPLVEQYKFISGRRIVIRQPLLGRYMLFVVDEFWKSVQYLRGVSSIILTADNTPAHVDKAAHDALRSLCVNDMYCPVKPEPDCSFSYRQRVSPSNGPLAYHVGLFDGKASRNREAAVFNLFGREQRVLFKVGDLLAA